MKTIPLNHGQTALVDDEDFEWLCQWRWHAKYSSHRRKWVAARSTGTHPNSATILMHRQILNLESGEQTDHVNGDTLDNRRRNLRACDGSQNCMNCQSKSGRRFKGVFPRKDRFRTILRFRGKTYRSTHATAEEAARAYNELALRYCPEFAKLNEI